MLNGLKQGMKFIDGLGDGEYQQKIDTQLSGEIGEMMRSIQYAQQYLHRTEIKSVAALNRVEEQEQFMENLTNNMQNGVYALDAQGLLNFINPAAEQMLGYSAEELLGKNIHQMIHAHQPDGVFLEVEECPVHQAIIRGDKYQIERDWFICKDKTFLPVEFNTAPLLKQGLIVGSVAVFHDITPRLEMEKQLQQAVHSAELSQEVAENANRSKSDFLANMSHEIRTPMNAIIGMGHLALQTDLDPKQRGYMSKIQHAANSLLRIINDILDFSKIEAGKLDIEMTNFHLDEVVDNLDHLLAVRSREKGGIEVLFSVDPAVPNELVGDPLRLGQVLINLASNAIKFTKEGEVVVKVSLLQKSTNGEVVLQFSVKDDGIGMNQAQLSKLFTPFTQADSSTTRIR
jgi:two-component system sensor histidine kinase/response regulator